MCTASSRIGTVNLGSHPQIPQGPLVATGPLPPQGTLPQGVLTSQGALAGFVACPHPVPSASAGGLRTAAVPLASRCSTPFSAGSLASFSSPSAASPALGQSVARETSLRGSLPLSSSSDGVRSASTEAIAGMDMIGELFQQQAKRLEVQLYQQLRDRKQIELVNVQLQQNVLQLQQLQRQNSMQSRLIGANEQSLHVMYEQARTIHSERNTVVALCERLAQDAHALRQSLAQENPRRYGHLESIPLTQVPKTRFDLPPISALFSQNANFAQSPIAQGPIAQGPIAQAPIAQGPIAQAAWASAAAPNFAPNAPRFSPNVGTTASAMGVASGAPPVHAAPAATSLPAAPVEPAARIATAVPVVLPVAREVPAAPPQLSGGETAQHEAVVSTVKVEVVDVKMQDAPLVPSEGAAPTQQTSLALLSTVASHSSASRPNLTAKPHRGNNSSDGHSMSGSSSSRGRRNKQATAAFPTLDSSVSGTSSSRGASGSGSGSNRSGSNDGSDCAEDGDSNGSDGNGSDSGNGNGDSSHGDSANGEGSDSGNGGSHEGSDSGKGDRDGGDLLGNNGSDTGDSGSGVGEGSDSGNLGSSPSLPENDDDAATPRKRAPRGKLSANPGASASKRRRQ